MDYPSRAVARLMWLFVLCPTNFFKTQKNGQVFYCMWKPIWEYTPHTQPSDCLLKIYQQAVWGLIKTSLRFAVESWTSHFDRCEIIQIGHYWLRTRNKILLHQPRWHVHYNCDWMETRLWAGNLKFSLSEVTSEQNALPIEKSCNGSPILRS